MNPIRTLKEGNRNMKVWKTPEFRRFGCVSDLTLASEQENMGKCPGLEDDAECAPPGRVGGCEVQGCGDGGGALS
jgi:hypothetical protein